MKSSSKCVICNGNSEEIYNLIFKYKTEINSVRNDNDKDAIFSNFMYEGSQLHSLSLVKYIISQSDFADLNAGLIGASKSGDVDIINYLFKNGAEIKFALYGTASGGHEFLFDIFVNKVNDDIIDSEALDIFESAIEGGNKNILDFILKRYIPDLHQLRYFIYESDIKQETKDYLKNRFNL